jgi:hypothetical protein
LGRGILVNDSFAIVPSCQSYFILATLCAFLSYVVHYSGMGDEKKKETKIEKKDEFGDTVEKKEIEEKEEED